MTSKMVQHRFNTKCLHDAANDSVKIKMLYGYDFVGGNSGAGGGGGGGGVDDCFSYFI